MGKSWGEERTTAKMQDEHRFSEAGSVRSCDTNGTDLFVPKYEYNLIFGMALESSSLIH